MTGGRKTSHFSIKVFLDIKTLLSLLDILHPRISRKHTDSDSELAAADSTKKDWLINHLHLTLLVKSLDNTCTNGSVEVGSHSTAAGVDITLIGVEAAVADENLVGVDATLAEHTHATSTSDGLLHTSDIIKGAVNDIDHLDLTVSGRGSIADAVKSPLTLLIILGTLDTTISGVVLKTHGDTDDVLGSTDDLVGVLDTDGALDEADDEDGALLDAEDLADPLLELVDLAGVLDLRNDDDIDRSVRKDGDEILVAEVVDTVDTDHLLDVAKVDSVTKSVTDDDTSVILHGRIDTILNIEDDTISLAALTLGDHVAIGTRDVKVRTTKRTFAVGSRILATRSHVVGSLGRNLVTKLALEGDLDGGSHDEGLGVIVGDVDGETHVLGKSHGLDDLVSHLLDLLSLDVRAVIDALDVDLVGLTSSTLGDGDTSVVDAHALTVKRLTDDIKNSTVTPLDNTDDTVLSARTSVTTTSLLDTAIAEVFDGDELEAELLLGLALELLKKVLALGVDGNTLLSDDGTDAAARGGDGGDLIDNTRVATTSDGHGNDGELGTSSSILVTTSVVLEGTITVSVHINVEVDIDLSCTSDHDIEVVDNRARVGRIGVLIDISLDVLGPVLKHGLDGLKIEGLAGGELANKTLLEHVNKDASSTTVGHTSADALLLELLLKRNHGGERGTTSTSLEAELRSQETESVDEVGAVVTDLEGLGVGGQTSGTRDDTLVVTDGRNDDDAINPVLADADRSARILDEVISDNDDVLGKLGVDGGVSKRTAGALAEKTIAVTLVITSRGSDESNIDLDITLLDGTNTSTVRANDHDTLEITSADAETKAVVGTSVDGLDCAILEERDKILLTIMKRRRSKVHVLDTELLELLHNRDENTITSTKVVVERNSHAIMIAELLDDRQDVWAKLGFTRLGKSRTHGGKVLALWGSSKRTSIWTSRTIARNVLGNATTSCIHPKFSFVFNFRSHCLNTLKHFTCDE
jgi:hypothetical protein